MYVFILNPHKAVSVNSEFYRKTNRKSVLLIFIIILLVAANGVSSLYLYDLFLEKTGFYIETLNSSKAIQLKLQKQIRFSKEILLAADNSDKKKELYYQFSRAYTEIQNDLFNFHYSFLNQEVKYKIENLSQRHGNFSKNYLNFLFNEDGSEGASEYSASLQKEETEFLQLMDVISGEIENSINSELDKTNNNYILSMVFLLLLQLLFTVVLLFTINLNSKKAQKETVTISRKLNRYLPPQLIHSILYGNNDDEAVLKKKTVTVCFTDLEGFTEITGRTAPEMISGILNEYLIDMSTIVHAWGGMIDKFMGDGIMILFNAFDEDDTDHAFLCVNMALAMQHHLVWLNRKWRNEGKDVSLSLRIGVNTGEAVLGSFGPEDRKTFTAVGNTVNIASRLEGLCPSGEVLVSSSTKAMIENRFVFAETGKRIIKGFQNPQETFIVRDLKGN